MKRTLASLTTLALIAILAVLTAGAKASPAAAAEPFVKTTLHFKVLVGPANNRLCDIIGDLYVPTAASSTDRAPAVLTTNGFGGSKDGQADTAAALAERGYVVLSYSGLGFGGSSCKVTLDDPDFDGKAASQLVSYLGGADGIAFTDVKHQQPAPALDVVQRDAKDHQGVARKHDPRVGTFGGSYGGGFQFAVASIDARVDALVPMATWNDLSYSLAPNGTTQRTGVSTSVPGAAKLFWATGFTVEGVTADLKNSQVPPDVLLCPNFSDFVCPALIAGGATGFLQPDHIDSLRHASVASYAEKVTVPTLLVQGQRDTLFNLNEAVATYRALEAQGTETKLIWMLGGHSGDPAPGELDWEDPESGYVSGRVLDWFESHLKDRAVDTGPEFAYFRDWVDYSGNAEPAYGTSATFPTGQRTTWRLSGKNGLATGEAPSAAGSQAFITPPAGLPSRFNTMDVFGNLVAPLTSVLPEVPGTFAAWSSPTLSDAVRVAGSPKVTLKVNAPTAPVNQLLGHLGQLVLFVRVVDVAPDGKATLINGLEMPVRLADARKPFTATLPAIVHEFAPGHQIRLVVAGGSINYRGGLIPTPVTIASGPDQALSLPLVH